MLPFLTKRSPAVSLRQYLLVPFLWLLLLMNGLMIGVHYWMGQQSIMQFSHHLSAQIAHTVATKLEQFFAGVVSTTQINQDAVANGLISMDSKESLQRYFLSQIQHIPYITFISMANGQGEYIGSNRSPDTNEIQLMTALMSEDRQLTLFRVGPHQEKGEMIRRVRQLDARTRPWYQQGFAEQKLAWYPIYKYLPYKGLGMGVVAPVYDKKTGLFDGVLTVDIALDHVSNYLQSLNVGPRGVVFLVDDKGKLAATNLSSPVYVGEMAAGEQLGLDNYPDSRLQAISSIVSPQGIFDVSIDGKDYVLHKQVMRDELGLYFVIGVLLAKEDLSGVLSQYVWVGLLILSVLIVLGVVAVRVLAGHLVKPMLDLTEKTEQISQGNWRATLSNDRSVIEFNQLANAFNRMTQQLSDAFNLLEQRVAERTSALMKANAALEVLSHKDGLTGLANRRYFDEHYAQLQQLAVRSEASLAVLMLDIDWFKGYNDKYGHIEGDACLKVIADVIQSRVHRSTDLVARYGGEEFVVVLYNIQAEDVQRLGQSIVSGVADQRLQHEASPIGYVTISMGMALWHKDSGVSSSCLVETADQALYAAKHGGRNQMVVFDNLVCP